MAGGLPRRRPRLPTAPAAIRGAHRRWRRGQRCSAPSTPLPTADPPESQDRWRDRAGRPASFASEFVPLPLRLDDAAAPARVHDLTARLFRGVLAEFRVVAPQ